MSLIRFNSGLEERPTIFDDFFKSSNNLFSVNKDVLPAVNIKEDNEKFVLDLAAPGVAKDDLEVSLENNVLEIAVRKSDEKKEENENYTLREFGALRFNRRFTVPKTTNTDKIRAEFKNGILSLTIPKKEKSEQELKKMISIK